LYTLLNNNYVGEEKEIFNKINNVVVERVGGVFFLYGYGGT